MVVWGGEAMFFMYNKLIMLYEYNRYKSDPLSDEAEEQIYVKGGDKALELWWHGDCKPISSLLP